MFGIHRYGTSAPNYGKRSSEEVKNKMSIAQKEKWKHLPHPKSMLNRMWIYNIKLDTQRTISVGEDIPVDFVKGKRPVSDETKRKISLANKGRKNSEETRKLRSLNASNRICINNNIETKRIKKDELINYDMNTWKLGMIKGWKWSQESKDKLSKSKIGHPSTRKHK